jgi:hypothetical protein
MLPHFGVVFPFPLLSYLRFGPAYFGKGRDYGCGVPPWLGMLEFTKRKTF